MRPVDHSQWNAGFYALGCPDLLDAKVLNSICASSQGGVERFPMSPADCRHRRRLSAVRRDRAFVGQSRHGTRWQDVRQGPRPSSLNPSPRARIMIASKVGYLSPWQRPMIEALIVANPLRPHQRAMSWRARSASASSPRSRATRASAAMRAESLVQGWLGPDVASWVARAV